MLPSKIFFDNFFDDFEPKKIDKLMKCDIYEKDGKYNLEIDIPGFKKEDIKLELENGYLKIEVEKESHDNEDKKYVRRERQSYTKCSREFYVGDISEEDIKAEFNNGILTVIIPKEEKRENKKIINID